MNSRSAKDAASVAPWYAAGLQFSCTQCGRCCGGPPGYIWVSEAEVGKLAQAVGLNVKDFTARHLRKVGRRMSLYEKPNGDCEFLARDAQGKALCTVYDARPVQCRTWPFWPSNLESERDWKLAGKTCPGLNTGTHHPLPVIQAALARNVEAQLPL